MLRRFLDFVQREIAIRRDPVAYARGIGVHVGEGCKFYGAWVGMFGSDPYLIRIGNRCHITNGVRFVTHDGGTLIFRAEHPDLDVTVPIFIGDDVYIGVNAIVMPGVTIGDRCVIGAGAIVTRDIPAGSLAVGAPARVIKSIDDYLATLQRKSIGSGRMGPAEKEVFLKRYYTLEAQGWRINTDVSPTEPAVR